MLDYFYHVAFDATAEITNTIFADGKAVVEGVVVGKHIGKFAGIPATHRDIRVPICVVYDLENDQVKRARVYLETAVLMEQLGAGALAASPRA
jgi:predicted ester cyclase